MLVDKFDSRQVFDAESTIERARTRLFFKWPIVASESKHGSPRADRMRWLRFWQQAESSSLRSAEFWVAKRYPYPAGSSNSLVFAAAQRSSANVDIRQEHIYATLFPDCL